MYPSSLVGIVVLLLPGATASPVEEDGHKKCLKFLQIPRTGGTTSESLNLHLPKKDRAYDSFMAKAFDEVAGRVDTFTTTNGQHPKSRSPGDLFDEAHGAYLPADKQWQASSHYALQWLIRLPFKWVPAPQACSQPWCYCQDLHTAPAYSPYVANYFKEGGCETFCTVRDPLDRALSAYKFVPSQGPCSAEGFNSFVAYNFPLKRDPTHVCHYVPQTQFVYGALSKSKSQHKWCDKVLRFENITDDFNNLMEEYGHDLKFPKKNDKAALFKTETCHIDKSKLTRKTKDLIYDYYKGDYEAFGYPKP